MGCSSSKVQRCVLHGVIIEDSIHTMLERDRRNAAKRGVQLDTFTPGSPHPCLRKKQGTVLVASEAFTFVNETFSESSSIDSHDEEFSNFMKREMKILSPTEDEKHSSLDIYASQMAGTHENFRERSMGPQVEKFPNLTVREMKMLLSVHDKRSCSLNNSIVQTTRRPRCNEVDFVRLVSKAA